MDTTLSDVTSIELNRRVAMALGWTEEHFRYYWLTVQWDRDWESMRSLLGDIDKLGWGWRFEREPGRDPIVQIRAYEVGGYPRLFDTSAPTLPRAVAEAFVLATEPVPKEEK